MIQTNNKRMVSKKLLRIRGILQESSKHAKKRVLSEYAYCGHVSCALMSKTGKIYTGININSKCALGNCTEHAAILDMLNMERVK